MRRVGIVGIGAAAAVAIAVVPAGPSAEPGIVTKQVTSTTLACPEAAVTADSATVVGAVVSGGLSPDRRGSARLHEIDAAEDLARVAAPATPVQVLVSGRSQPSIVTQATGGWAPEALSGMAARDLGGISAGISSTSCPVPAPEWWFVGAGSQVGRGSTLLVGNPAQEPARFDVRLFGRDGPVEALAGKGIDVAARGEVRLRLDALAPDEVVLAVNVQATYGRVAAALWDVAQPVDGLGRGVDFIPAAQPPGRDLVVAGIPGGEGRRDLVLVNPTSQFATMTTRLLTDEGPVTLDGLATVAVPAASVASVDLARVLAGRPGALHLVADTPITGVVRSAWGGAQRDVMWLSATPRVTEHAPLAGAAVVPGGQGLTTTVSIAAPDADVFGTLAVARSGAADKSIFTAAGGPLADGSLSGTAGRDGRGSTELVLPGTADGVERIRVNVPAGSQRSLTLDLGDAAVAALWWLADPSSGSAAVSHATVDLDVPLATGYQWWPAASYVRALPVRADIGTLVADRR